MSNKVMYELVFAAKNNASGTTKQVASEVAAVKEVAAEAQGAAKQMQSAYASAVESISADMKNGTSEIKSQIAIQRKTISDLRKQYQDTYAKHQNAPTNHTKQVYGNQLNELRSQLEGEKQAMTALEQAQKQYEGSTTSLRTQLMNLRNEMAQMRMDGKANTREYEEKRQAMERLGTAYRELQTEQQALSTGATQWGGAISGLQGLIGLYSAGSGVVSLFTKDQEKLQAVQAKMQSVMGIMMGMQQVANTLHATSAFRIVTVRRVTELWRAAQIKMNGTLVAGSVAAKVFWASVSLGATVVIGAAIAAVSRWIDKNQELKEQAAETAKKIAEANDAARKSASSSVGGQVTEFKKLQTAWNALGKDLVAKGKFISDNKGKFEDLGVSVRNVAGAENLLVTNESTFIESLYKKAAAMAAAELASTKYKQALEELLAAEGSRVLNDEEKGEAQNTAKAALKSKYGMSEQGFRGAAPYLLGTKEAPNAEIQGWADTYSSVYAAAVRKILDRKKATDEAAFRKTVAEGTKYLEAGDQLSKEVSAALNASGIKEAPKNKGNKGTTPKDNYADTLSKMQRDRVDVENNTIQEGLNREIAIAQTAHDRYLSDAKTAYDNGLKLAENDAAKKQQLTDEYHKLIESKDKEHLNNRIEILKKYSDDQITEYMRQTGDVTGATQAMSTKLTTHQVVKADVPKAEEVNFDSDLVAKLTVRLEGIEKAKTEIERLRAMLSLGNLTSDQEAEIKESIASWEEYAASLGYVTKRERTATERAQDTSNAIGAVGSVVGATSGLVNEQAGSWLNWGSGVISAIASAIPAIVALTSAQTAQANASTVAAAAGSAASVASIPIVGWIMAGAAVASVIAAIASVPKFANGGIAYGPTLGLFGEYSGATNNPEVVAPLDKLRSLIDTDSGGTGTVRFRIEGRTLVGILEKENKHAKRRG